MAQRAADPDVDPAELVAWAGEQLAAARDQRQGVDVLTSSYDDFFASVPEQRRMVVPGLLGEGDRMILTGQGGVGKSTMSYQIAVCAAAGVPPFDWHTEDAAEPKRVMMLDFENRNHRVKTRLWPIVKELMDMGADPRPNLTIGGNGNPLDLLNPQNAMSLLRTIEHDEPNLVYVGPLYRMHCGDPDKESDMKKVATVLDAICAMGAAVITEAHHTKEGRKGGTLEPSGANLWTWWPEFGLGLRLQDGERNQMTRRCTLERWRIDRDPAAWPDEVEASGKFGLAWARADSQSYRVAS
jgi:replicative DNA helicase